MSRLIVVSNRVPLPDRKGNIPAGGLAVAMHSALQENGGIWMGWSGESSGQHDPGELTIRRHGKIDFVLTTLTENDISQYYNGFANRVLWPIFHCRLDLAEYGRSEMAGYFRVNRFFADRLLPLIEPDDIIWIHDYHLIPLADELRKRGVANRIGFFLHIPWPAADILFAMPVYDSLLNMLAAYDLIGFQTAYDLENFVGALRRDGCGEQTDPEQVRIHDRQVAVGVFPISIETAEFAELAMKTENDKIVQDLRDSLHGETLIIGVDRLDYSKGISERIAAFDQFLNNNPSDHGAITLLQITPKSRSDVPEYMNIKEEIAAQCGNLNGRYGTVDWVPIRYVNQSLPRSVLAGLYRQARVGLVTPLRDGMNLVAKEYVAAQDPDDPGVLILSRFAGAARELTGALQVNPYDTEQMAAAIGRALSMPLAERKARWHQMMRRLLDYDLMHWCEDFMRHLRCP